MASPTSPQIIIPAFKRLVYGVETAAAGTPAAVGLTQESCQSIVTAIQRTPYQAQEYVGAAADLMGIDMTAQYAQITVSVPFRVNGFAAQALACILGNACDVVSGTAPNFTHTMTPSAVTTRCNTMTIWHDTGDRGTGTTPLNVLQMAWATVQSVKLTYQPTSALNCEVTMLAQVPSSVAPPTVNNFIGSSANFAGTRVMGYQGQFDIFRGDGTTKYVLPGTTSTHSNMVMSGDMTLTRPLDPVVTAFNITPQDFVPGPLALEGSFDMRYDGAGSASVWNDYLSLQRLGTSVNPNVITYTIDANNSVSLTFQPVKWTNFSLSDQGQQIRAQVSYTGYNDLATLNVATPALSIITTAVLKNQQSAVLVS